MVGTKIKVRSGEYAGMTGVITRSNKHTFSVRASNSGDGGDDDEGGYWDASYTYTVFKSDCNTKGEVESLNEEIRNTAMILQGLVLKRDMILNPGKADAKLEKILECVEV